MSYLPWSNTSPLRYTTYLDLKPVIHSTSPTLTRHGTSSTLTWNQSSTVGQLPWPDTSPSQNITYLDLTPVLHRICLLWPDTSPSQNMPTLTWHQSPTEYAYLDLTPVPHRICLPWPDTSPPQNMPTLTWHQSSTEYAYLDLTPVPHRICLPWPDTSPPPHTHTSSIRAGKRRQVTFIVDGFWFSCMTSLPGRDNSNCDWRQKLLLRTTVWRIVNFSSLLPNNRERGVEEGEG